MCVIKAYVSEITKMKANVVSHSVPMPEIYSVLPPLQDELNEVLAFLYLSPNVSIEKVY